MFKKLLMILMVLTVGGTCTAQDIDTVWVSDTMTQNIHIVPLRPLVDMSDINYDGETDIDDLMHWIDWYFTGGPAPPVFETAYVMFVSETSIGVIMVNDSITDIFLRPRAVLDRYVLLSEGISDSL